MAKRRRPEAGDTLRLAGAVAIVAGATRGAGRGIARALAEAGAVVYCTGRSVRGHPSPYQRPETIEETAEMIKAQGGTAVAVRVDHTVEAEVKALIERVERERGRLDVLVNSLAGEDPRMGPWTSFWTADLTHGEEIIRQALLSHLITAKHAAAFMIKRQSGLLVEVTENDLLLASGNIVTQIVKLSQKAVAAMWAAELRKYGVAALAITPGFLRSETMLERFGVTEENWREAGKKDKNFLESESPLFVGRAIAALAQDPNLLQRSGHLFSSWDLGREYQLTDADGRRPDWGALDVDYSRLPAFLVDALRDALQMQSEWLKVLSSRTEQYRTTFLKKVGPARSQEKDRAATRL